MPYDDEDLDVSFDGNGHEEANLRAVQDRVDGMAGAGGGGAGRAGGPAAVNPANNDGGDPVGGNARAGGNERLYRFTAQRPVFSKWMEVPDNFGGEDTSGGTDPEMAAIIREFSMPLVSGYETSGEFNLFLSSDLTKRSAKLRAAANAYHPGNPLGGYELAPGEENASPMLIKGRVKYDDFCKTVRVDKGDGNGPVDERRVYDFETYCVMDSQERCLPRITTQAEFNKKLYGDGTAKRLEAIRDREDYIMKKTNSILDGKRFGDICDIGETKADVSFSGKYENGKGKGDSPKVCDELILIRRRYVGGERLIAAGFGIPGVEIDEDNKDNRKKYPGGTFGLGKYDDYPPDKFLKARVRACMDGQPIDPNDDVGKSGDVELTKVQFERWMQKHRMGDHYRMDAWFLTTIRDYLNNRSVHTGCEYSRLPPEPGKYLTGDDINDANYDCGSGIFGTQRIFKSQVETGAFFDKIVRKYDSYPCEIFSGTNCDATMHEARCWMRAHAVDRDAFPSKDTDVTGRKVLDFIHSCGGHLDEAAELVFKETEDRFRGYPVEWAYDVPNYESTNGKGGWTRSAYVGYTPWTFIDGVAKKRCWMLEIATWMDENKITNDLDGKSYVLPSKSKQAKKGLWKDADGTEHKMPSYLWYLYYTKFLDDMNDDMIPDDYTARRNDMISRYSKGERGRIIGDEEKEAYEEQGMGEQVEEFVKKAEKEELEKNEQYNAMRDYD